MTAFFKHYQYGELQGELEQEFENLDAILDQMARSSGGLTNNLRVFAFRSEALAYAEKCKGASVETVYMRHNDYEFYLVAKNVRASTLYLREDGTFQ